MLSKKILLRSIFVVVVFLLFVQSARAEKIERFDAVITINPDASITVKERILMNFETETSRHGIYRYIPIRYRSEKGDFLTEISNISVTDGKGQAVNFAQAYTGADYQLKIGDKDIIVKGKIPYDITYTIKGALNFFEATDEMYWDITGSGWKFPIDHISAKVVLPRPVPKEKLGYRCFAGPEGQAIPCSGQVGSPKGDSADTIVYSHDKQIAPGSGMTVVANWPTGLVQKVDYRMYVYDDISGAKSENFLTRARSIIESRSFWSLESLQIFGPLFLPFLTLGVMIFLWHRYGRDPLSVKPIVAQYEPPDGLSPLEVGSLIDDKTDNKDISSEMVHLAVQGFLRIEQIKEEGLVFNSTDYRLVKLRPSEEAPSGYDKLILSGIFGDKEEKKLSELKNDFYDQLPGIRKMADDSLTARGFYKKSPIYVRNGYVIIGALIFIGSFLLLKISATLMIGVAASGVIIGLFSIIMPSKSAKGAEALNHIQGFRSYLSVAEKDRLDFHNAPEKNPDRFEKLLPYAMVLGVEAKWAAQFADIYKEPPKWYSGRMDNFSAAVLAVNLASFNKQTASTVATAPSSSGMSGGSSGGGFGGGGGGSW